MGVRIEPRAELHVRHRRDARMIRERSMIAARYRASARDLFPDLRACLLASRPIVGDQKPVPYADGVTAPLRPVYGKTTFRNVIDENGRHV